MLATSQLGLGGTERQLVELASRLAGTFDVTVVALYGGGPLAATLRARGIPLAVLGRRPEARGRAAAFARVVNAVRSIARLYALLRRRRPDVFHGFLYGAYVPGALLARLAGVPAVVASRRSLGFYKARNPLLLAAERLATRFTDLILPNSVAVLEEVRAEERIPALRLRIVWNAVEALVARRGRDEVRAACGVPGDALCGVVVANLIAYKGHSFLIEAISLLPPELSRVHVWFVGDGPESARLQQLTLERGVAGQVHFCGASDDIGSFLHASDFGILPSLTEGLSNALLEKMAAGLAVVATRVGGNADAIRDGVNGLLVPPGDPERLAAAIARVASDPALRSRLGAAAQTDVLERFSYAALVTTMTTIYRELAERTAAR